MGGCTCKTGIPAIAHEQTHSCKLISCCVIQSTPGARTQTASTSSAPQSSPQTPPTQLPPPVFKAAISAHTSSMWSMRRERPTQQKPVTTFRCAKADSASPQHSPAQGMSKPFVFQWPPPPGQDTSKPFVFKTDPEGPKQHGLGATFTWPWLRVDAGTQTDFQPATIYANTQTDSQRSTVRASTQTDCQPITMNARTQSASPEHVEAVHANSDSLTALVKLSMFANVLKGFGVFMIALWCLYYSVQMRDFRATHTH